MKSITISLKTLIITILIIVLIIMYLINFIFIKFKQNNIKEINTNNTNIINTEKNAIDPELLKNMQDIAIIYGLGSCLNDFFTENTKSTILPAILVLGLLSIIFGFIANYKLQKNKKSLIGIILGIISIFVSIIGRVFFWTTSN